MGADRESDVAVGMMSVAISEAEHEAAVEWPPRPTPAAISLAGCRRWFRQEVDVGALALQNIRLRYRGSVLGPLWLTEGRLVMVVIRVIFGRLFHADIATYLPVSTTSANLPNSAPLSRCRCAHTPRA